MDARLELRDISKRYGGVRAIRHADLVVEPGSVHAIVGENGAGKSTLIKIVAGAEGADTGSMAFEGAPMHLASTQDAMAYGIQTVYQEPQLFADLTVSENIFIGRELTQRGRVDWAEQHGQVLDLLELLGLPERYATRPVRELSIAEQQQVSIAKALAGNAKVLILDEPSAILTDSEIEVLFGVVRRLTDSGVSVIYISHRLDELPRICDRVTVMRDGRTVGTWPITELTIRQIVELMVGGELEDHTEARTPQDSEPRLALENLAAAGHFSDVNVEVRPGEIVGLYGLVGSGVAEIAEVVYGMRDQTGGRILLEGKPIHPRSPRAAQKLGIALLPANRKAQGMFAFQSIAFNIGVGNLSQLSRGGWMNRGKETSVAKNMIDRLAIKTPTEQVPVSAMSGGNAQKVVLARQLVERPPVLVLAEPTQGVDVGAKEEIHRIIAQLADDGTAVLVVTSDLSEALRISDRIHVVVAGTTAAEFAPGASQADVLAAAAGADADARHASTEDGVSA
ncbi:sugar ABC transporter ATP-binding protein [Luteipulveratus mongoliensis]|uniref:sugar ABC transporter ATP-binding protein n=1 Tax=Luteipulveratus mongoliensis TaxID=571913 RepID=UPI000B0D7EE8|nr:sugar ABC transporter ATP-binding protein [Luteipulveratus mongoliensis]